MKGGVADASGPQIEGRFLTLQLCHADRFSLHGLKRRVDRERMAL
jgi:hypothetical protein